MAPFDIESHSGKGLLDGRVFWASIIGPQRLAIAQRRPVMLSNEKPAEIYKNLGASGVVAFVGVALPFNAPANPLTVGFSSSENIGFNSGLPVKLTDNMLNFNFTQLLLPGEQLFAQIMGAIAQAQVVVAAELF